MPNIVMIVEGHGDVQAMPSLVGKIGGWLQEPLFTRQPIRAGGWGGIRKAGGLEKYVALAASRAGCEKVLVVVDLDDECPVEERNAILARIQDLEQLHGIEIWIGFCLREFEAWILASLPELQGKELLKDDETFVPNHHELRDAKGALRRLLIDGYSEASDQGDLVKFINPPELYQRDRSFRRFVKILSGLSYDDLSAI